MANEQAEKKKYYTESTKEAAIKYKQKKIKRVPLDMQVEEYERIKEQAEKCGESVNGYIKLAVRQRMERDSDSCT